MTDRKSQKQGVFLCVFFLEKLLRSLKLKTDVKFLIFNLEIGFMKFLQKSFLGGFKQNFSNLDCSEKFFAQFKKIKLSRRYFLEFEEKMFLRFR